MGYHIITEIKTEGKFTMKRKNKTLALILTAVMLCLSTTACSSGEENGETSAEGDMPQISVDMSESAQTTPENDYENTSDSTESSAPEAAQTENNSEAAETTENTETSIINTESTSEAAPETAPATSSEAAPTTDDVIGQNGIVEIATAMLGKPYYFGGADPETGFDNSGLMHYVLRANGVDCPRLTGDIAEWGEKVAYDELKLGYLVFFEYEGSGKADFGGIYTGNGKMIVSTDEDRPVSEVDITTDYYKRTFQFGIKTW